nr:glycosyltransferase family 2 protein [Clostridia bacterium]
MKNHLLELTILMPCFNEHETICGCVDEALDFMAENDITGEVLVSDNGSTDGSDELAYVTGARVIRAKKKGYGCAIRAGIRAARGRYIIMADSDGSYDFRNLEAILEKLREGWPLVMGNRFLEYDGSKPDFDLWTLRSDAPLGGIEPDAMPTLHKIGVPVLSAMGRFVYGTHVGDFHCGLRGFNADLARSFDYRAKGMEFATEIIGRFAEAGYPICEVPVTLSPDGRIECKKHLRTFRDGMRHVGFMAEELFTKQ